MNDRFMVIMGSIACGSFIVAGLASSVRIAKIGLPLIGIAIAGYSQIEAAGYTRSINNRILWPKTKKYNE